jgi:hypothetical protein
MPKITHPSVVDMLLPYATAARRPDASGGPVLEILRVCRLLPRDHGHQE